ncbi:MAG: hypothetical protein ACFFDN_35105 [Candidatus Hodarchaeota archaeon]
MIILTENGSRGFKDFPFLKKKLTGKEKIPIEVTRILQFCDGNHSIGDISEETGYPKIKVSQTIREYHKKKWIEIKRLLLITSPPKKSTLSEIEQIKKQLQRETAKIPFKINERSAFSIIVDQISALDLSEILIDEKELKTVYSGVAMVTNDNILIESRIHNNNVIITIWTKDIKQATGYLAYLKNLINMAFESTLKLEGKTERLGDKILDSNEIIQKFLILYDFCENKRNVGDILILLKEIKSKIEKSFPNLALIKKIEKLIKEFEIKYGKNETIPERFCIDLEFQILKWLSEINKIAHNNLETYQQTFPEQKDQIQRLSTLIKEKNPLIAELEQKYTKNILQLLIVIEKVSGISIYRYNFTQSTINPDLIGGFLTAIQSFGSEIAGKEEGASMTKLAYKNFEIALDDEKKVRAALILKGRPTEDITNRLRTYIKEFESKFKEELINWSGDTDIFKPADDLIKKFL